MKKIPRISLCLMIILLVGCAYSVKDSKDPIILAKVGYLEALKQFDDVMLTVNSTIKSTPAENRSTLKTEFDKYVKPMDKALDAWKIGLDIGDLSNVEASQVAFAEAKTKLLTFIYSNLTK